MWPGQTVFWSPVPVADITHSLGGGVTLGFGLVPLVYGTISGIVTDSVTGLPIAGAVIGYNEDTERPDLVQRYAPTPTTVNLGANSAATETGVGSPPPAIYGPPPLRSSSRAERCLPTTSPSYRSSSEPSPAMSTWGFPTQRIIQPRALSGRGRRRHTGGRDLHRWCGIHPHNGLRRRILAKQRGLEHDERSQGLRNDCPETGYWSSTVSATVVANATTTKTSPWYPSARDPSRPRSMTRPPDCPWGVRP